MSVFATVTPVEKPSGIHQWQVVSYANPIDWDGGAQINWHNYHYSDHHRKVYLVLELSDEWLDTLKKAVEQYGKYCDDDGNLIAEDANAADRTGGFDGEALMDTLGIPDLVERGQNDESIEILDCTGLSVESYWIDAESFQFDVTIEDHNVVSSGSYTVGSGGNYATRATAGADVIHLTGDLTFTQISDTSENTRLLLNNIQLNGHALTLTSTPTNGSVSGGYKSTYNTSLDAFYLQIVGGGGTLNISNLYSTRTTTSGGLNFYIISYLSSFTLNFHDNLCDGNSLSIGGMQFNAITAGQEVIANVYNNIFWDFPGVSINGPIIISAIAAASKFVNNTGYNGRIGIAGGNKVFTATNNVFYGMSFAAGYQIANASGYNNATSDTSMENGDWAVGSGNVSSITAGAFVSLDDTSADFLNPTPTGALDGTNTTSPIAGHDTHINGVTPLNCIGAAGIAVTPTFTSIDPDNGDVSGGTGVTIAGTNFGSTQGGGSVTFDGEEATAYASWSDTEIECTTPAGSSAGLVDVVITHDNGNSVTETDGFEYTETEEVGSRKNYGPFKENAYRRKAYA